MAVHRHHELARLIDQVKADRDYSDEDIAQTARRAGHQLSKQWISEVRKKDPLLSIVPSTVRALAAGLGVPVERVTEAALLSAGLRIGWPSDWSIEAAIDADPQLPVAAKRMLLAQVREAREGVADGAAATPVTRRNVRTLSRPETGAKAARKRT